eukprot:1013669_1
MANGPEPAVSVVSVMTNNTDILDDIQMTENHYPGIAPSIASHQTNVTTYSQTSNMKYSPANTEIEVISAFDPLKLALSNNNDNINMHNAINSSSADFDSDHDHELPTITEEKDNQKPLILTDEKLYKVGSICRIHSLQKQIEYNDKFCRIIGYQKSEKNGDIDIYYVKILDRFK